MGYHRAGFEVIGVDINPQPHYPFEFVKADALTFPLEGFDAYHASPPCQFASLMTPDKSLHPNLIPGIRSRLKNTGKDYLIENVYGARRHLINPIMLCGTMFGLQVIRHRYFEASFDLGFNQYSCCHYKKVVKRGKRPDRGKNFASIVGSFNDVAFGRIAMGIDWMSRDELSQAIPPAYTEWLGLRLMEILE
jgi:DNA (cytosine-5)-methyltransferase 1